MLASGSAGAEQPLEKPPRRSLISLKTRTIERVPTVTNLRLFDNGLLGITSPGRYGAARPFGRVPTAAAGLTMTEHIVPHFHNDVGVAVIEIGAKEFMCIGALPPFDHPHVFCDMGDETNSSARIVRRSIATIAALDPHAARPPECA